jgi:3-oxoacyl-[acyl-carrier protein] reductase
MSSPAHAGDVALVTGGARGLGAEIVRALHQQGFRVAIGDVDGAGASILANELDREGLTAMPLSLDVRSQPEFEAARDEIVSSWGSIEVLVNNAALTAARPVLDITPEQFDAVMAVNLRGTFVGSSVLGRAFRARGYGRIVNVASLAGQNGGTATGAHYAASKGGIITLTKVFARELAPFGVTVNAVSPGPLDTEKVHEIVPVDQMPKFLANVPAGCLGSPRFVADIVARLCARDASYVTGATWDINGGLFMR